MPTLELSLTVPEGTVIRINGLDAVNVEQSFLADPVEEYFTKYLSNNGRKIFAAAARIEDFHGRPGFTFEDLAENLSITYESAKSFHRTAGRSAKRWKRETGTDAPISFTEMAYVGLDHGDRTMYQLPTEVAEKIRNLPVFVAETP